MRLALQRDGDLPSLAWCARLSPGADVVRVRHGPGVETGVETGAETEAQTEAQTEATPGNHWLVAGAWDGPYAEMDFAGATLSCGTAVRAVEEGILFSSPAFHADRLHSIRCGGDLLVSNSLAYALEAAGAELRRDYAYHPDDLTVAYLAGVRAVKKQLALEGGGALELHDLANFLWTGSGGLQRRERNWPATPEDFASYRAGLADHLGRLLENAADPARRLPFGSVVGVSRGYDSPASAVLAAERGCRDALCLRADEPVGEEDDSGAAIARRLGLNVTEAGRMDWRGLPGMPEVEFGTGGRRGGAVPLAVFEAQLSGRVFINGNPGDQAWSLDPEMIPDAVVGRFAAGPAGQSPMEFRLRCRMLDLALGSLYAFDAQPGFRLSRSAAMAPWRIGGDYDRPIPRRIVEEAGIERDAFGMRKGATGSVRLTAAGDLGERAEEDFRAWLEAEVDLDAVRHAHARRYRFDKVRRQALRMLEACLRVVRPGLRFPSVADMRHAEPDPAAGFRLVWSVERLRARYEGRAP